MDGFWFDQLARKVDGAADRRAALKLLAASVASLRPAGCSPSGVR
jgi:hypothetical protein